MAIITWELNVDAKCVDTILWYSHKETVLKETTYDHLKSFSVKKKHVFYLEKKEK